MMLFEKARENASSIRQIGLRAIERAKKAGVPAFYIDASIGDGIIRQMPDGTRQRLVHASGEDVIVETLGPHR